MYNKILVPLDGSQFSECSLEHVKAIALGCQVPSVILLRVAEGISSYEMAALSEARDSTTLSQIDKIESENTATATNYITSIAQKLNKEGITARGEVTHGRPDEAILNFAEKNQVDLIIMSTHGRSGISRWAIGSVADRIVHHARVPVLLVSAPGCRVNDGSNK